MSTHREANLKQLADDVHLLTAPMRFVFRSLLTVLLLLLAPLLYATIPYIFIAVDPNSDFSMLALAYLVFAPFASALWLMLLGVMPEVLKAQKEGEAFDASFGHHAKAFGLMFLGFFGSAGAEVLFLFYLFPIPPETSDVAANASNWRSLFAGMGIAGFFPVILLLGWRAIKWVCAGHNRCRACHETVGAANLDSMRLCHYCYDDAINEKDYDREMEEWVRKVRYEFGDRQWAWELRRGRKNALKWKRRILRSRLR